MAGLALLLAFVMNIAGNAALQGRVPDIPPLPDLTHDNFDQFLWGFEIAEWIISVFAIFDFALVAFHKYTWIIARRFFTGASLLYFARAITLGLTIVHCANRCFPSAAKYRLNGLILVQRIFTFIMSYRNNPDDQLQLCCDYIFSGHTAMLLSLWHIVRTYTPKSWWPVRLIAYIMTIVGIFLIIVARAHYKVGCILAVILGCLLWSYCEKLHFMRTLANFMGYENAFENLLVNKFRYCYERGYLPDKLVNYIFDKHGILPNIFVWPLPWPKRWVADEEDGVCEPKEIDETKGKWWWKWSPGKWFAGKKDEGASEPKEIDETKGKWWWKWPLGRWFAAKRT
ncbi:phosphatidylcholine:ceramide cholinephosphotransferase 1-like [Palaemon carinicauda]|uniref:phosphatidylcholine:ceramide cholinephosphotransferase 1-like n=1 Tax=Palaemon carinicauda TaxID=392227 RepID=UPI0035B6A39E